MLFKNVAFLQLPTNFVGLEILEVTEDALRIQGISAGVLGVRGRKIFSLEGLEWSGYIVAGTVAWTGDVFDYTVESTLLRD